MATDTRRALLLGSAVALLEEMGAAFKPFERHLHDSTADKARELSGDDAFQAARRDGGAMSLDAAIGHALADDVGPRTTAA